MMSNESLRPVFVGYAKAFGTEIPVQDVALEASIAELIGFLADIDSLDLQNVAPAGTYDPRWSRLDEAAS